MIRLNGSIWVDDVELLFDNLEVEIDEDLELPFDELDEDDFDFDFDDEEDYCDEDCETCKLDEDISIDELVDVLTDTYVEILNEGYLCDECTKQTLTYMIHDFVDLL